MHHTETFSRLLSKASAVPSSTATWYQIVTSDCMHPILLSTASRYDISKAFFRVGSLDTRTQTIHSERYLTLNCCWLAVSDNRPWRLVGVINTSIRHISTNLSKPVFVAFGRTEIWAFLVFGLFHLSLPRKVHQSPWKVFTHRAVTLGDHFPCSRQGF